MELGNPPLYMEANRVARDMDCAQLLQLGPFLKALSVVTWYAESKKREDDKIKTGEMIMFGSEWNMAGAFILWRGAAMMDKWI